MNNLIIFAIFLGAVNLSYGTSIEQCKDDLPTAVYFDIPGCFDPPCPVKQLSTVEANITIDIPYDIDSFKLRVIALDTVPYLNNVDACKNLHSGYYCPLEEGERVTYKFQLKLLKFPTIEVPIKVYFYTTENGKRKDISCSSLSVQVVPQD